MLLSEYCLFSFMNNTAHIDVTTITINRHLYSNDPCNDGIHQYKTSPPIALLYLPFLIPKLK